MKASNSLPRKGGSILTIYRMLRELPHSAAALFWLSLASFLSNLFSLAIPLFFMQVYDRLMVYGARDTLLWMTLAIILVLMVDSFVTILRSRLSNWYAMSFASVREQELMKDIYSIPEDEFRGEQVAELDDKFRSLSQLQSFFAGQFFQAFLDIPFIAVFLAAVYLIGGSLVSYHILILLIYFLLQAILRFFINRSYSSVNESRVGRLAFLREFLDQIHYIKAQSLEESMLRKLDALQEDLSHKGRQLQLLKVASQFIGNFLTHTMVYGTIIIGGFMVLDGELTIGVVTAVTMLARRIIGPVQSYNQFSIRLTQAETELKNMKVEFEGKAVNIESFPILHDINGNLELRDLCCSSGSGSGRKSGKLNMLNFSAAAGKTTAIYCKDPEGADTLRDLLQGVKKPDSGKIIIDSFVLSELNGLYQTSQIAVLPRKGQLFSGTILDNITYFNPNLHIQALDAASLIGLDDSIAAFPKGYETEMRAFSNNIVSAGIIQRIAIARTLVHRPRVLISDRCDELMDRDTLNYFLKILKNLKVNTTLLLVTSRPEILNLADDLFLLEDGTISLSSREALNV